MSSDSVEQLRPNATAAIPGSIVAGVLGAVFFGIWAGGLGSIVLSSAGYSTLGLLVGPAVAVVILVAVSTWGYFKFKTTRYEIHPDKVRKESGIFSTTITDVEFEQVTDITYSQGATNSMFDVGNIKLNTAGGDDKELSLRYVAGARSVYERLNEQYT